MISALLHLFFTLRRVKLIFLTIKSEYNKITVKQNHIQQSCMCYVVIIVTQ